MLPDAFLRMFPTIDTAVYHIKFSQGLEKLASVMDRGKSSTCSTQPGISGFILHSRYQYHWHRGDGRRRKQWQRHTLVGIFAHAWAADPAVPAFINIGQRFDVGEGEELKAFTTQGSLEVKYGPFNIPFPEE